MAPTQRRLLLWGLIPLLLELVTWQGMPAAYDPYLQVAWESAQQMAVMQHLSFGTQLIFTYGPLGFLNVAATGDSFMWFGSLAVIAFLYTVLAKFALCLAVFTGARRAYGLLAGFVVALIVLRIGQFVDLPVFLISLVWALDARLQRRTILLISTVGGAVAGIEALEKLTVGAAAAVMVAIFVATLPSDRRRNAGQALGAFLVAIIAVWLITGESLMALPQYLYASEQVSSGYTAAMEQSGPAWMPLASLGILAFGLWGAWATTVDAGRRRRIGVTLLWVCFWWAMFKEGFVREAPDHPYEFFAATLNGLCAFRWHRQLRVIGVASLVAVAACILAPGIDTFHGLTEVRVSVSDAVSNTAEIMVPSRRTPYMQQARSDIMQEYPIPKRALALLKGHSVEVYPSQVQIAWAYHLNWKPLPAYQSYAVYTPWLDQVNARFVASRNAPSRILGQTDAASIDGRVLPFDEPETSLAILCHYRLQLYTTNFVVLRRSTDRCGSEQLLKTVHAGWDQTVKVPRPPNSHSLVLAKITGVQVKGLESIEGLLWKPAIRSITINGYAIPYRLVEATAGDGLPLVAATNVDFPFPFGMTPAAKTISVSKTGQGATTGSQITYSFYVLQIKPST